MSESVKQKTINAPITIKGVGLHTGRKCRAVFLPAPDNTGICFVRTDLPTRPTFEAHVKNVVDVVRGTTLGQGESRVYTIEHILSALNGLEISNLVIEMDDSEPPVLDGSSKGFVEAILESGIKEQESFKNYFSVETPMEYSSHQTVIRIEPADTLEINCRIDYNHPMIGKQIFVFSRHDDYSKTIAPARTFCFDYEIEALKKKGLAKGGSLDNAIVIGPEGIYNPGESLRFNDEFVRHKILDLMGDLMLLGSPLKARVIAKRCGHGHNVKFLRALLQHQSTATGSSLS
jgi:UDP-3-O-acyl N-acetylglucosamine deacetylase